MNDIYFDHSATTPVCPEALEAYTDACTVHFGNPSSRHSKGLSAAALMQKSRAFILSALDTSEGELVFTANGTEANNLAIFGHIRAKERYTAGCTCITTCGEHASVEQPMSYLSHHNANIVRLSTKNGVLSLSELEASLDASVALVSLMLVNNETGALYDVAAASSLIRKKCPDALIHTDATQGFLKVPFSPSALGVDMVTVSGHKVGAPKGIGALWISPKVVKTRGITAQVLGGGQENGLRSGTENLPAIAAFGAACRVGKANFSQNAVKTDALRAYLLHQIEQKTGLCSVFCRTPEHHAPHILSVTVPNIPGETTLNFLSARGICVSSGSACSSNSKHAKASQALLAYGLSEKDAACTIRLSFAPTNTESEADTFIETLTEELKTLYYKK